jgi:hypothetical protein
VYWLAGDKVEAWDNAMKVVGQAAVNGRSIGYLVEHHLDENSIVAVRDAIISEVVGETKRIEEEILSGELGEKAIQSRKNEAAALRRKVVEYENILGVALGALKQGLESIEQSNALASLLMAAGPGEPAPQEEDHVHASVA